jgi:hypothetical protein
MKVRDLMPIVKSAVDDVLSHSEMMQQDRSRLSFAIYLEVYNRINKLKEKHNDSKDKSWNG